MLFILASVSTIGEAPGGANPLDATLDAFSAAAAGLAAELGVPFVPLRATDEAYETANNCLALHSGVLTVDGVHPNDRGAMNLANMHASGLLAALSNASAQPKPIPPYGGRVFLSAATVPLQSGIVGADGACAAEAPGAKALLADESGCAGGSPCRRASLTPFKGDGQVDWPLLPSRSYFTLDNTSVVGFTNRAGLFAYPNFKGVSSDCRNQATGLRADLTTAAGGTCGNWGKGSGGEQAVGWSCATGAGLFDGGHYACPATNSLLCVAP